MSKREDIITAALEIISEQGISALTLPVLFKRAHTGAGTFYHYFDDRSILINGVFERCFDTVNASLVDVWNAPLPPKGLFDYAIETLVAVHEEYPREMNFLYSFTYAHVMPERDFCRVIPSVALLTHIISMAQEEGLVYQEPSAIVMGRMVRAMLASVVLSNERGDFEMDENAVKRFSESAWASIGGER